MRERVRAAWTEVSDHFPAWMFLFYGCLILNTELTAYDPPLVGLAWTVVFPVAVFVTYYAFRSGFAPDVLHRGRLAAWTIGLALGLPMLNVLVHRPAPVPIERLRELYEWSNFFWGGLLVWHAATQRRGWGALFFGAGLFYGVLLENGGILLGFFHETNLRQTIVPPFVAPIATILGWCVVLYMATFVVWKLRALAPWLKRSSPLSALAVGAFATMLDLQIDPVATASGCWVWDARLPPAFEGVPAVNFVAWMCALVPIAYVFFRYQERAGIGDDARWTGRHLLAATALVPPGLAVAALGFIAVTGLVEGTQGPSWSLLHAFTARAVELLGIAHLFA